MKKTDPHKHSSGADLIGPQAQAFLSWAQQKRYSAQTLLCYQYSFKTFFSFLAQRAVLKVQHVSREDLEAFGLALIDKGLKPNTQEIHLTNIRAFFGWMERAGEIFLNPFDRFILPRPPRPILPIPTEREIKKLLAQPNPATPAGLRDRALLETAYSTGARREELWRMRIADPDLKEGRIRLLGKGRKERTVPLGKHAVHWLREYILRARPKLLSDNIDQQALWLSRFGTPLGLQSIRVQIRHHARQAGIRTPISPHTLRRACATHMLRGGAHPVQIQMLLGHASLATLSQYLRVTVREMMKMHKQSKPGR